MPNSLSAEHVLATILSSTEDGLLSFGLDGTVQTWSRGAERLYGYGEEEMRGQPLVRLLPVYEVPSYEGLVHAAIRENFPPARRRNGFARTGRWCGSR
jgi:PAS domain S-box-containing protein